MRRSIAVAAAFLIAGGGIGALASYQRPEQQVAGLLNLRRSPPSLRNVQCESWGMTDGLSTCVFEIEPQDFPALLTGWRFVESSASGGSYRYSGGPKLGREFQVTRQFAATPPEFRHGGRITLVTNERRTRGQIDYYEE